MSAAVVISCEAPVYEAGVCRAQVRVSARTIVEARQLAAEDRGWWHHDSVGDRCPDHGPRRRP